MRLERLAILGPGLLGGSILLAQARSHTHVPMTIWARRQEALAQIKESGVACVTTDDLAAAVHGAKLVVFCTPIGAMKSLAEKIQPLLDPDAVVTDVGSVKGPVVEEMEAIFGGKFVGAHPMTGSDCDGFSAARAALYEDALCILTPTAQSDASAVEIVEEFWQSLGCHTASLTPTAHDAIIARVSHLPHLVASCLVATAIARDPEDLNFSGPGFRDATRIARGPVAMWTEILLSNRESLVREIDEMSSVLAAAREALASGDSGVINDILDKARQALINRTGGNSLHG